MGMTNEQKIQIALAAKKKLAQKPSGGLLGKLAGLKRDELVIGGKKVKEVNPFMKA
jgi:hypothetical protein